MHLPESKELSIQYLSRLFDKMSESYKLFWFQALVDQVAAGEPCPSYDALINHMIADAWYMVSEYRLNLGPADNLESLVHYVCQLSGLKSTEKKAVILRYLQSSGDRELLRRKRTLILNVPYRLQAPFMPDFRGSAWDVPPGELTGRINRQKHLIYYFVEYSGLQTRIKVQPEWEAYLLKNQEIVRGWIQFNMIQYLQRRNPSVPGIASKLYPPQERKLEKVKKFWKTVIEVCPMADIYAGEKLTSQDISIDHFVPWSYVAHDEFWNLSPTTRSVNSSKGSNLPDWNKYFPRLCELEYLSCQMVWQREKIHKEFEMCLREHVNSPEIRMKLYRRGMEKNEFSGRLEEVLAPIYQSAKNIGFGNWEWKK